MTAIGFIGLGNMGAHMARNLIRAGHDLQVYDLNDETVRYIAQAGAKAAESAADAAAEVDFVVTMLPVGSDVRTATKLLRRTCVDYSGGFMEAPSMLGRFTCHQTLRYLR